MILHPSDSITVEILPVKGSSAEMSHEKGPSSTSERKSSKATKRSLAIARRALAQDVCTTVRAATYATGIEQAYKISWRADPYMKKVPNLIAPVVIRKGFLGYSPEGALPDSMPANFPCRKSGA
ncbi:hypothetical protein AAC387_Pa12g0655 [Persea americana]